MALFTNRGFDDVDDHGDNGDNYDFLSMPPPLNPFQKVLKHKTSKGILTDLSYRVAMNRIRGYIWKLYVTSERCSYS